jgi:enoyl-CoA hydratase/carnithine racemase
LSLRITHDGSVTTILLDRPNKAHAYDRALLEALQSCLRSIDSTVLVIGSTGQGAFCAGADLQEMKGASPQDARELFSQAVFEELAQLSSVTIAAIQGAAVAGGFELALACDLRIAGPHARFSLPEVHLGLIPSAGGCTRLPDLVGPSRAKEMILGGRKLSASDAVQWGIVARIEPDPLRAAQAWAQEIASADPTALELAKTVLRGNHSDRLDLERLAQTTLYARKT